MGAFFLGTAGKAVLVLMELNTPTVASRKVCTSLAFAWNAARAYTSSAPGGADEAYVGAYTPITRKLWVERASKRAGATPVQQAGEGRSPKPISVTYNFSTDRALQDMRRNPWGHLRVGRLLEDLDSLAGNVAFEHCHTGRGPPLLVTAAVDEITVRHPLQVERDIVVHGQVVWTGKSSLDIRMQLFQAHHAPQSSLEALFSFVHLDPVTGKAAPVAPLRPESTSDLDVFQQRQAVADARRAARQQAQLQQGGWGELQTVPPEAREWIRAARRLQELPALASLDAVLMPFTCQHNTFICQPQHRNTSGRVFGGFLMRRAYELAFATTYMFGGVRPTFQKVDEITFTRPVDVGDLLRLTSTVAHAAPLGEQQDRGRVVIEVEARVTKPEAVDSFVSNTFTFVYELRSRPGGQPLRLKRVLPTCEEEGLRCWRARQLLT
ncbi:hypothetical protein VOLCADRAFT_106173 [Volvox carteri f. nagariensis]|uniref:HotDog ACOT-type domain-containing protein n=1 Tax=Volvox carteri f. nagariensis TaxID=3068 RepID=D8U5K2_VOLCA|nr:uncharacterized protein VOLCADRAFT_106173 [Volvox carteri f. nagariensis]EFJ45017.1 hypothetical protein VOLCADRAFT_106173 [Volvox carteri f. nagariensis]|eukprot:XP_002953988.1 hypothetical protein VOLCADRAFT_106173 [Volvox carteri f. nagariensis]